MIDIKIIDSTYDFMFKAIMLDPENKMFLKEIIHHVTKIPMEDLKDMVIENVEHIIQNKDDKKMRSDIIVSIDKYCINIEINKTYYEGLFQKNNGYINQISSRLYKTNEKYIDAKQALQINFDNFSHFESKREIHKFVMKEMETNEVFEEMGETYHIDMEFIRKTCYNKPVDNLSRFERSCLILTSTKVEDLIKFAGDDEILKKVADKIISLSSDEEMIGLYDAEEQARKIRNTLRYTAIKEGMEKGMEKGISKGSAKEKIKIAKNLLKQGVDIVIIKNATGLTLEEISKLKQES